MKTETPGHPRTSTLEQAGLAVVYAAHGVIVQGDAVYSAIVGEDFGLWLDLLGSKNAPHGRQQRVAVEQFEVPRELLDAVDIV